MSTAREVLDAIDLALDDWTVSGDGMRWTPQQEADRQRIVAREAARRRHAIIVPPPIDPERAGEAFRQFGERWLALVEALRPAVEHLGQVLSQVGQSQIAVVDALRQAAEEQHRRDAGLPTSIPLPPRDALRDTDPRAYALAARRARGTGPDRQVQHRPRPRSLR